MLGEGYEHLEGSLPSRSNKMLGRDMNIWKSGPFPEVEQDAGEGYEHLEGIPFPEVEQDAGEGYEHLEGIPFPEAEQDARGGKYETSGRVPSQRSNKMHLGMVI